MNKLTRLSAVLLLIGATFLVYWPALRNGFVWDDTALALRDPLIRSWRLIPEGFRHFLFLDATASDFYRPMQRLTFVLDYQLYGLKSPGGWHLTSVFLHAGAAGALFFTMEALLRLLGNAFATRTRVALSIGIAALWAIHPLHTSAVTYVAGRADPLAALFGFSGLAFGLTALQSPDRAARRHFAAGVCFLLAMLSKESGIFFLPLWLLLVCWTRETRRVLRLWLPLAAIIVAAYAGLRFNAERIPPPKSPPVPGSVRPILAARAFAEYSALLVAPVTLRMERDVGTHPYDRPEDTLRYARLREFQTLAGVLLVIGFILWLRWALKRATAAAVCLTAFVIVYLPISNVFSLNATLAEHWLYVPSAFFLMAAALTLHELFAARTREAERQDVPRPGLYWSKAALFLVAAWAVALGVRTFIRQADWRDQRSFVESTIAAGGKTPRMLMNLANVEFSAGHGDRAIDLYKQALQRAPDQHIIWLGFAGVLVRERLFPAAHDALEHAAKSPFLNSECDELRASLVIGEQRGDPGPYLRSAIERAPANWEFLKRYLEYLRLRGDTPQALLRLRDFLRAHPFRAESWRLLAQMLEEQHQLPASLAAYREASDRDVRDVESDISIQRLATAER